MTVYDENDAKRDLGTLLEEARAQGEVRIKRNDGQEFSLRAVKKEDQTSLSSTEGVRRRDLSDLAGSWVEDAAFEEAIIDQNQIDPALWK
jgi:hypothetical protein